MNILTTLFISTTIMASIKFGQSTLTLLVIKNCNNFVTTATGGGGGELAQQPYPAKLDGSLWRLRAQQQKSKSEGFVSLVLTGGPPTQEHFEHPYWILLEYRITILRQEDSQHFVIKKPTTLLLSREAGKKNSANLMKIAIKNLLRPTDGFLYDANNGSIDIYAEFISIKYIKSKRSDTV